MTRGFLHRGDERRPDRILIRGLSSPKWPNPPQSGRQPVQHDQLLVVNAEYLPATVIKPRPAKQFERDFVNIQDPSDAIEIARRNNDGQTAYPGQGPFPPTGAEATNMTLRNNASRYYYYVNTSQNIFNPFAWAGIRECLERGDFKNKITVSFLYICPGSLICILKTLYVITTGSRYRRGHRGQWYCACICTKRFQSEPH